MIKRIDRYIIRKYFGTFLLSMVLILSICVVFDVAEKIDDFHESNAPLRAIIFDYYMNFIPYFANMLTPLFSLISVIFFTSKMAYNTEIVAMLAGGISFHRIARPYMIVALLIGLGLFGLVGYVIPRSNEVRLNFEDKYIQKFKADMAMNVQFELEPGIIVYIERYEASRNRGVHFSLEEIHGKTLVSRMTAQHIICDSANHWHVTDYLIRHFDGMYETIEQGQQLDTMIAMDPSDFYVTGEQAPQMTNPELHHYMQKQKARGMGSIQAFENEYYQRFSMPFSVIILTFIGLSLSAQKVRGGTGLHVGIGIGISAVYILFNTVSTTFAVNGTMPILLAVWLPNMIFGIVAALLYVKVPK